MCYHFDYLPLTLKTEDDVDRDGSSRILWDAGSSLWLFLVAASARYGSSFSALNPFPEIEVKRTPEQISWICSDLIPSLKLHNVPGNETYVEAFSKEASSLVKWIVQFKESNLGLRLRESFSDKFTLHPDYIFDVRLPFDPEFDMLRSLHGSFEGYHGSRTSNWYSIIRNGLQIRSWTSGMRSGAILGSGLYLSTDLQLSLNFSEFTAGWDKCPLGSSLEVVGVYEILDIPALVRREFNYGKTYSMNVRDFPEKYILVKDSKVLRLKTLLIWRQRETKFVLPSMDSKGFISRLFQGPRSSSFWLIMILIVFIAITLDKNWLKKAENVLHRLSRRCINTFLH